MYERNCVISNTFATYWAGVRENAFPPIVKLTVGMEGIEAQFTYIKLYITSAIAKNL